MRGLTNALTNEEKDKLAQQRQQAQLQQAQNRTTFSSGTTGTTFSSGFTAVQDTTGTVWNTLGTSGAGYGQARYMPHIDRLEKLEPGWFYVRWRKSDDCEAEAWAVPIIALAVIAGHVEYQLAGANVQAQSEVRPETFLGIVTPKETYDHAVWCEKARAAYYDFHAAEVAAKLLNSAAAGGKAA